MTGNLVFTGNYSGSVSTKSKILTTTTVILLLKRVFRMQSRNVVSLRVGVNCQLLFTQNRSVVENADCGYPPFFSCGSYFKVKPFREGEAAD
ncbi:hypothetical protein SLE2022_224880 [Rubroshorea leprosula]